MTPPLRRPPGPTTAPPRRVLTAAAFAATAFAVVSSSAGAASAAAAATWWVDPITVKIPHTRQTPFASSRRAADEGVDVAAQRGECERVQLWSFDNIQDRTGIRLAFSDLAFEAGATTAGSSGVIPAPSPGDSVPSADVTAAGSSGSATTEGTTTTSATRADAAASSAALAAAVVFSWKQQGYVFANTSKHYLCAEDVIPPSAGPPPPPYGCSDTPRGQCMTGCPADPNGTCGGGNAPKGSCNMCACNKNGTPCPMPNWRDGHPCVAGWYPDPLLDVPAAGVPLVPKGFTQPLYVELCVPRDAAAGNYTGRITITSDQDGDSSGGAGAVVVPVRLEVWPIDLPLLNSSDAFNTAFRFGSDMSKWYPPGTPQQQMWDDWLPFLAHHRVPGDDIYLSSPRPTAEYVTLAATGAKWMGMMDAGIRPPVPAGYVDKVLQTLEPMLANMSRLGLSNKMYVYGFDEMPEADNASVYEIFGAIKKRWPEVTTMAVLDWETFPADLPLDIWVDEYADYGTSPSYDQPTAKEVLRQTWLKSSPKHQFWWYWCIGPTDPSALNTFVERPAIQARLLFWLTALHAIPGMLYYDVAIWSDQCPSQRPCLPCDRINNTGLTDFNPATWNGNGHSTDGGGANGDGSFTYPGPGGKPLGSIRLSNIADGIEDWQLLNRLGATHASVSNAADLITQLVRNETVRVEDPALLERARREAARRVIAQAEEDEARARAAASNTSRRES